MVGRPDHSLHVIFYILGNVKKNVSGMAYNIEIHHLVF